MKSCQSPHCIYPVFSHGYCRAHQGLRKDEKYLNGRKSMIQKHFEKMKKQNPENEKSELDKWFLERRKEMTGVCANCGGKTAKDDDKYFRHSIAHLLPKRLFPSIATHPDNWIELCFWNASCHSVYDSSWAKASLMNIFPIAIEKIQKLYPKISSEEKKYLPEVVLQEINTELI